MWDLHTDNFRKYVILKGESAFVALSVLIVNILLLTQESV